MNDSYTRIPKDLRAVEERLQRSREKKNTISHKKTPKSKGLKNNCIVRGIRDSLLKNAVNYRGGCCNIDLYNTCATHTPSAPTPLYKVINFFPETVTSCIADRHDNAITLPFTLPAWRALNETTKPYFYQLALAELERVSNQEYRLIPFVFNESKVLTEAIGKQRRKRVDFIRDRLQKSLKASLNRTEDDPVMFWFAFETAHKGQPHYQGSLLLKLEELKRAREAFYIINRMMTLEEKRGALRFRGGKRRRIIESNGSVYADLNWADYNLKERGVTRREYNNLDNISAATHPLKKHTEDYYNRLRVEFKIMR